MIFRVEQPGIASVCRKQCQGSDRHKAAVVFGSTALDVSDFIGEMKVLTLNVPLAWLTLGASPTGRDT